ncbi:periplasmic component [Paenibacillus popilliae ATCC 14706]|uniref:Periplasmic component n=1 Tax=Paenibacillus popilliae ATCC 14706 TaxID=1212764 RepID=M9M0F7_PAEPP|nr:periplasmic component [Paenibacillus popilliae ATCC 14706]
MSVYEALSVMFQFGLWIFALLTFVVTLLILLTHKEIDRRRVMVSDLFRTPEQPTALKAAIARESCCKHGSFSIYRIT